MSISVSGLIALALISAIKLVFSVRLKWLLLYTCPLYTLGLINFVDNGIGINRAIFLLLAAGTVCSIVTGKKLTIPIEVRISGLIFLGVLLLQTLTIEYTNRYLFSENIKTINEITFNSDYVRKNIEFFIYLIGLVLIRNNYHFNEISLIRRALLLVTFSVTLTGLLDYLVDTNYLWGLLKNHASHPVEIGSITGIADEKRISGITVEPSHLAIFSGASLLLCLPSLFKKNSALVSSVIASISLLVLINTFSLSVIFFLAVVPLCICVSIESNLMKSISITLYIVVTLIIIYLIGSVYLDNVQHKLNFAYVDDTLRLFSVKSAVKVISEYPLLGIGLGNFNLPSGLLFLLPATVGLPYTVIILAMYLMRYFYCIRLARHNTDYSILLLLSLSCFLMGLFTKGYQILFMPYLFLMVHLPLVMNFSVRR